MLGPGPGQGHMAIIDLGGWARTGSEAAWQLASFVAYPLTLYAVW